MNGFEVLIASCPDKENLVAEVLYNGVQWAGIFQDPEQEPIIQFYSHPRQKHWEFSLTEALAVLELAKKKIFGNASYEKINH